MSETLINLFWDGKNMTYTQGFSSVLMKVLSVYGAGCWLVAFTIHIGLYCRSRKATKVCEQEMLLNIQEQEKVGKEIVKCQVHPKRVYIAEVISDILFWIGACFFALIFPILSGFGFIWTPVATILMLTFFTLCLGYQTFRHSLYDLSTESANNIGKNSMYTKFLMSIKQFKWFLAVMSVIVLFLSIFVPLVLRNSCLCIYNSGYGLPIVLELDYSTQFTRKYWLPEKVCKDDELCHVYATVPSDTSRGVFINVHTGGAVANLTLIATGKTEDEHIIKCVRFGFPHDVEERGQRHVFTCLANDLYPSTLYQIKLFPNAFRDFSNPIFTSTYKTLPGKGSKEHLRIQFGGDFGFLQEGRELVSRISTFNPDVIMIGGDVAYDNGNKHCYYSWDLMLWAFEEEFTELGRLVPFVFAVGNHDVGFNALASVNVTVGPQSGPLYFTYFPHHYEDEETKTGIPPIEQRRTYYGHFVGNLLLIGLDSGYLYKFSGAQADWLDQTLETYSSDYYIFTHYHNPIYPTCWSNSSIMSTAEEQIQATKHWLPLFDKYRVVASFENHVHQFKRTYPLKNGKVVDEGEGTVYFGDGAMGIKTHDCKGSALTNNTVFKDIFAAYQVTQANHYWIMDVDQDGKLKYQAFSPYREVMNGSTYSIDLNERKTYSKTDL